MASNKDAPVLFALPAPRSVGKGLLCLCRKVFWQNGGVVHFVYAPVCKNDAVELLKDPSAVKLLNNPKDDLLTIAPNGAIIGVQQTVRTTLPIPPSRISPISPSICASERHACVAKQAVAKSHVPIKPRLSSPKVTPLSSVGEQVETVTLSLTPSIRPSAPSEAEHAPSTSPDLPQSSKTPHCQQIIQSTSSNVLPDVVIGSDSNITNECKDSNSNMPKISAVFSLAKTYTPPAKKSHVPVDSIEDIIEPLDLSVKNPCLDGSKNHQDKQYSEIDSIAINLTLPNKLHSRSRAPKATAAVLNLQMATVATLDTPMETVATQNTPTATIALSTTPSATVAALNSPTATIAAPNKQTETAALQNTTIANVAMLNQPTVNCNLPTVTVDIHQESKSSIKKLTLFKECTPKKQQKRKLGEESCHKGTKKQRILPTASIAAPNKQTDTTTLQNTTIAKVAISNQPTVSCNSPTATVDIHQESKPSIKNLTMVKEGTPKKHQKRKISEESGHKRTKKQRISIINGNNPLKLKFAWKKTPKKSDVYNKQSKDKSLNGVTLKSIVKKNNINANKSHGHIPDMNKTVIKDECMKNLTSNSEEQNAGKYKNEEDVHLTSFSGTDVVIVNGRMEGHKFTLCSGIISINGRIPCVKLNRCNNTIAENETKRDCSHTEDISSPSKSKGKPRGRPPKIHNTNKTINDDATENECSEMEDLSSPSKSKVKPRGRPPKMHNSNNTSSEIESKNNTITCDETKREFSQKDDLPDPSQSKVKSKGRPPKSRNSNNTSSEIERKREYSQQEGTVTDIEQETKKDCVQKDNLPASTKSKVTTKGRPPKSRSVSHKPNPSIAFQSVPSIESFTRHPDFHRIPTNNKVEYLKELLKAQRAAMGIY